MVLHAGCEWSVTITRSLHTPQHARVAEIIADNRRKSGLTQNQVAAMLKRPQSFVAEIERGQRRVDVVELLNIASAVGFDPIDLIREVMIVQNRP